ncbi:hypothetical protein [Chromobacterium haemolyticum]|uniref:hypothetical protein n=1 Tax=Chromobacterium haemolyticum TaxID=394935 RepID=UPI0017478807|nr:hypothetical protein [Chromobacterium haemolyticum]QOD84200.1 hypothetical protein IEZ30_06920 [Chromobacterium haemolyticum]
MNQQDVLNGLALASRTLLQSPVSIGVMSDHHAKVAQSWPAHPSGTGGWNWTWLRNNQHSPDKHFLHLSTNKQMFAALLLHLGQRQYITLELVASDPNGSTWKGKVLPSIFLGLQLANQATTGIKRTELYIESPAQGLEQHYQKVAHAAGYTTRSVTPNEIRLNFS